MSRAAAAAAAAADVLLLLLLLPLPAWAKAGGRRATRQASETCSTKQTGVPHRVTKDRQTDRQRKS